MDEVQVSMTELRKRLGSFVNRAAYGGERIVLVSRGEPKAAIVGVDDLERLAELSDDESDEALRYERSLSAARELRERIGRWQAEHGVKPGDASEDLRQLREARDDELGGVH